MIDNQINASGIKPEVKLSRQHYEMLSLIVEVWRINPRLGRELKKNFVDICNGDVEF